MKPIYLDYNATTPVDPDVVMAMKPALDYIFGNPSSRHSFGLAARKMVEDARAQVAEFLGCDKTEIVFTSGGTESNNHAIRGVAMAHRNRGRHIITTRIEHPAVLEVCRYLEGDGFDITYLPVDDSGRVILSDLEKAIRGDTILITVMHANNETGTIQPVEEISSIARSRNILIHTDAAQSAGKIPCRVKELGIDLLSLAGHKIYGPKGIGVLYIREGTQIAKFLLGADHERNRRAGTENVPEIVGIGKASELAFRDLAGNRKQMQETRDLLWRELSSGLPQIKRNGSSRYCLPNTLNISFPGTDAGTILDAVPEIAASSGAACHAVESNTSHVLDAMGTNRSDALGAIRFSTGKHTTPEKIKSAASRIIEKVRPLLQEGISSPGYRGTTVKLTQFTHGMGCACKLRPQDLENILAKLPSSDDPHVLVDIRDSDDAGVWKVNEDTAWVQSVDFFTPVVDEPFDFGAVAAANALSDIYAMGAKPLFALNIVAFPVKRLSTDILDEILKGAQSVAAKAGIYILGGHSIEDNELKFGMVVNAIAHPEKIIRNSGAKPGDSILLTKAIGTGILSTALKKGVLDTEYSKDLVDSMTSLNRKASEIMMDYPVSACTDVTGFGLLGHLLEILRASDVSAEISAWKVPLLGGVEQHLADGIFPGGTLQNLKHIEPFTEWDEQISHDRKLCLTDAQTSGGLLICVPQDQAEKLLQDLRNAGCERAEKIGTIQNKIDKRLYIR